MCVCVLCLLFSARADLFIMCQDSAPSLVLKRGQVGANCPDCQLSAAVGLFILTENTLYLTNTHFCFCCIQVRLNIFPSE